MMGRLRTLALFGGLTALMMLAGYVAAGYGMAGGNVWAAMLMFAFFAFVLNFVMYFWSHKFVLWSYKARIVTPEEAPRLHRIVRKVSEAAGLPMPTVAVIPLAVPNAFATGRNPKHAVVAATDGILRMLDDEELEGVMAHEIAHVSNRDMLVMTVAATVAGAVTFAARMLFWNALFGGGDNRNPMMMLVGLVFMVLAPVAAIIIQLSISRSREFKADAVGARISGKPLALAAALEKMEQVAKGYPLTDRNASSATASLFIVNPFRGGGMSKLFSTHPDTQERIRRLKAMA
ncbi:MAG TPA: zinc metalloprotease HtpX [Candidatus Thermoplasmatota archaeon]|nr:zinc metalloprotease HtpX [Candidatus Thermoplasmatota archaeon]